MARQDVHSRVWALVWEQHGVIARTQLLAFGYTSEAIDHRMEIGRLHPVFPGVYAVGRPELTRHGSWMAAVLSCGPGAVLSHDSAAQLFGIRPYRSGSVEISVRIGRLPRHPGISAHRRKARIRTGHFDRIPITSPIDTIIDLAPRLQRDDLEGVINEADKLGIVDPEALREALETTTPRPGVRKLRITLDRATFVFTDSQLERHFLPIARKAGLPKPRTQRYLNSHRVDFFFAEFGLLVETDGLRYHRTAAQQANDLVHMQRHKAAGYETLRFSHGQIRFERQYVEEILKAVAARLRARTSACA